jgi:hypothetical protein
MPSKPSPDPVPFVPNIPQPTIPHEKASSTQNALDANLSVGTIARLKVKHSKIVNALREKRANVDKNLLYQKVLDVVVLPVITNEVAQTIQQELNTGNKGLLNLLAVTRMQKSGHVPAASTNSALILPDNMVKSLGKVVSAKQAIFSQTAQTVKDPRIQVFAKSLKFVSFILNAPSFDPSRLNSFNDIVVLLADAVTKEIRNTYPNMTPEQHDQVFIQVLDLYISTIREAIYAVNSNSALVGHPDMKAYKPYLARFFRSMEIMKEEDMEQSGNLRLTDWTRLIFNAAIETHNKELAEALKHGTRKNLILSSRRYLESLADGAWQAERAQAFSTRQDFDQWRTEEIAFVTLLLSSVVPKWPDAQAYMALPTVPRQFTLLPDDPQNYYRALVALCVAHDSPSHPHDLLAGPSKQLLLEVGTRWRITPQFHSICFAEVMITRFIQSPADTRLPDVLNKLTTTIRRVEAQFKTMQTSEVEAYLALLVRTEKTLRLHLLNHFGDALTTSGPNTGAAQDVYGVMQVLALIYDNFVYQKSSKITAQDLLQGKVPEIRMRSVETLTELLLEAINTRYNEMNDSIAGEDGREITRIIQLAKAIRKEINSYIWRFPEAVLCEIDVPALASKTYLKYFVLEMENTRHNPDMQKGNYTIAEMLELYQIVRVLRDFVGVDHGDSALASFDIEGWFEPFVGKWLSLTDTKLDEWVGSSVAMDSWDPVLPPSAMHSSSVVDIFAAFNQTLDFIDQLRWPNEVTKGGFLCKFAKNIAKAMNRFVEYVMDPFQQIATANLSPDVPVDISPETCVRINDLLEAYSRLEDLVDALDIPHYSYLFTPTLGAGKKGPGSRGRAVEFSIQVMRARNLITIAEVSSAQGAPPVDYFVTLHMPAHGSQGNEEIQVGKTRIVQKNVSGDPDWQEKYPIVSRPQDHGNVEINVQLWSKSSDGLMGKRTERLGGARLLLSSSGLPPDDFSADAVLVPNLDDFLTQELELPMDVNEGELVLRITRENPEADVRTDNDMRFWVVRTAVQLETALIDSIQILVETIVRYARRQYVLALKNSGDGKQNVELALKRVLDYLDKTFGVINMYTDTRVGEWLADYFSLTVSDDASEVGSIHAPILHKSDRVAAAPPPNFLILYIWTEFVKAIHDTADAVDSLATTKQGMKTLLDKFGGKVFGVEVENLQEVEGRRRRFASCYLAGVEYLKALLYGDVEGVHYGFDVPALETEQYTSLVALLKQISEGRGRSLSALNRPASQKTHTAQNLGVNKPTGPGSDLLY